jgi:F-box protein 9
MYVYVCMYVCMAVCLLVRVNSQIPVGAILETVYYRYLYFQEDGRVLYALSSTPPHVMFKRLLKVCLHKTEDPTAVWGTFQIQKNACTVTARQSWHEVRFELTIQANSTYGRFGTLVLDRHLSSPSGTFDEWSSDLVEYKVPTEQFHFVKDARL